MPATLAVKPAGIVGATDFSITIELEGTVGDLKDQIASKLGLPSGVRLVCSGKVLEVDEQTLNSYGVKDGSKLFCVKELAKAAPHAASPTSQQVDLQNVMQNPMVQMMKEQPARYVEQLEELKSMGFEDEQACLQALTKHDGRIDLAVEMLAQDPDEETNQSSPSVPDATPSAVSYEDGEVVAHVYDISGGMAHSSSQMMIGTYMELLPHTGIVVFGQEYYYSREPAVCEPGKSLPSPVKKSIRLGRTSKTRAELSFFLENLNVEYTASSYNFLTHNSNHYADVVCKFLLEGSGLPAELLSLLEDMNATPRGRQMGTMMSAMESSMRGSQGGQSFFSPTGTFFHGGTPASPAFAHMFAGAGAGAGNGGSQLQGTPQPQQANARVRFQSQLSQLASMGFVDETLCLQALTQSNGDVNAALNIMLSRQ